MAAYLEAFAVARQHSAVPADQQDTITVEFAAEAAEGDGTVLDTHELAEGVFLPQHFWQMWCSNCSPLTAFPISILGVMKFFRAESLSFSVAREKARSHMLLALR